MSIGEAALHLSRRMMLSSCLALCWVQVAALTVQADNLKGKSSPYIKNYVNYGSDDTPETIPQERALNARPGKLGESAPALQHRKISPVPALPLGHRLATFPTVLQGHIDLLSSTATGPVSCWTASKHQPPYYRCAAALQHITPVFAATT